MVQIAPEDRPLDALRPNPANYNRHSPDAIEEMAAKIRVNGFTAPCIIRPDGMLLAGHLRRLALLKLREDSYPEPAGVAPGWIVPCRHYTGTEVNEKSVLVGDNPDPERTDFDGQALTALLAELQAADALEGSGYDEARLDSLIAELAEQSAAGGSGGLLPDTDPDAVPEAVPPRCQPGELWELGRHRLLCGDATKREDVERLLGGERVALMVTDPPYGVDYDPDWRNEAAEKGLIAHAASRVGLVANDERVDWREAWLLSPAEVAYCWHADRHASTVQASLESAGYEMRCQIIWAKSRFAISRGHYHWQHEPCWYAVRKGKTAEWIGDRSQTTLWEITLDANVDGGHSTQKPVECMARPLRNHAGDVYDPFLGSGTTLIAAEQLGRRCFGLEIEPKYCDVILARWEQATGLAARRAE